MRDQLVALSESLSKFEAIITDVERKLRNRKALPVAIARRLGSYRSVCETQRRYISEICSHLTEGRYDEVVRLSNLSCGLSSFVLEDSKSILNQLLGIVDEAEILYN